MFKQCFPIERPQSAVSGDSTSSALKPAEGELGCNGTLLMQPDLCLNVYIFVLVVENLPKTCHCRVFLFSIFIS